MNKKFNSSFMLSALL